MKHPPIIPTPGRYSFGTPCLRWKIIEATKPQHGFPGFSAPYHTRYLVMTINYTEDNTALGPGFTATTATQLFTIDRFTGARTPLFANDSKTPYLPFPYDPSVVVNTPGSEWTVSETEYTHTVTNPIYGTRIIVDVQLSDEYTLDLLDGDCTALIHAIDPATVDWFTLVHTDGGNQTFGDPTQLLPAQYMYGSIFGPTPLPIPTLGAAAWYALLFGPVGGGNFLPNVYTKAIGYFAMAGNYCEKTFNIDDSGNLLASGCVSGVGNCASEFLVTPPSPNAQTNAYVLIQPNCVCGG
jgi:hypothetical protein